MLRDPDMCSALVSYLVLFERKSKYEQDSIILQWVIYRFKITGPNGWPIDGYHVPFDGSCFDGKEWLTDKIRTHYLCVRGLQSVLGIGKHRWRIIGLVSKSTAIMPRQISSMNAAMKADDPRSTPLKYHLDYLLELGEVRATRVVATWGSDGGVQGHANRDNTVDMVYLPISMGYRNCYKRYMHSLGYKIRCKPDEAKYIVDGIIDGKPSDHGYVSFSAYYNKWKREYHRLKVSRPAEDICNHCFVFANRHRYLANHSTTETLATMVAASTTTTTSASTMTTTKTATVATAVAAATQRRQRA